MTKETKELIINEFFGGGFIGSDDEWFEIRTIGDDDEPVTLMCRLDDELECAIYTATSAGKPVYDEKYYYGTSDREYEKHNPAALCIFLEKHGIKDVMVVAGHHSVPKERIKEERIRDEVNEIAHEIICDKSYFTDEDDDSILEFIDRYEEENHG